MERLGIIGAGKMGMALTRAGLAAGYEIAVAGSGPSEGIALTVEVLSPGAIPATVAEVADFATLIVLAVARAARPGRR